MSAWPNKSLQSKFKHESNVRIITLHILQHKNIMANELLIPTRDAANLNFIPKTTFRQILRFFRAFSSIVRQMPGYNS